MKQNYTLIRWIRFIPCCVFVLFSMVAAAQQVPKTLPANFIKNMTGYYVYTPPSMAANPTKKYPVIMFLHGMGELAGSSTTLTSSVLSNGIPKLIRDGRFPETFTVKNKQFSFIVITPQFKYYPGSTDVTKLLNYVKDLYPIDMNRVYVTGLSMGGGVAWSTLSEQPPYDYMAKMYAAGVLVCGQMDPAPYPARPKTIAANNTPVWAFHNDHDPNVDVKYSRGWVDMINAAVPAPKPKAKLTIFTNNWSHDAWSTAYDPNYKDPETGLNIYQWLLQYTLDKDTSWYNGSEPPVDPPPPPPTGGGKRIVINATSKGIYYEDAMTALNVKPGDTLCIPAGDYESIFLGKLLGTPEKPIIIRNCGGVVRVGIEATTTSATFVLSTCKYFKVEGDGEPSVEYGFDVKGTNKDGLKMFGMYFGNGTSDFDVHHVYIHDAGMFLQAKTLQTCKHPEWWEGSFVMRNVKIHHLLCRNSSWEGFYIGNTSYLWNDGDCKEMKSHHIENLEIYDNDIENTGSDGIQIAFADMGTNLVHHNRLVNYAMAKNSAHGYGILAGGGTTMKIYDNFISKGYNPGIQLYGSGVTEVYNNVISNITYEGINATERLLFQPLTAYIYNNTISYTGLTAVKIYAAQTTLGHKVYNNLVISEGTAWDYPLSGFYIKSSVPIKFDHSNNLSYKTFAEAGFVDPTHDNFRLKSTSPALNAGRDMSDLKLAADFDGGKRPQDGKFDVGAFEAVSTLGSAPLANAGNDIQVSLPVTSVTLDGSASTDTDGTITSYSWKCIAGPQSARIVSPDAKKTTVSGLITGSYVFQLTVKDDKGNTSTDRITVNVLALPNKAPKATIGKDVTITLPNNGVVLDGAGSIDSDGVIVKYEWKKTSGPDAGSISDAQASNTYASGLIAGVYVYQLTVTDNAGATTSASFTVTVVGANTNKAPVANAGPDITITLPVASANLDGSASKDEDGTIATWAWKKISGPNGSSLNPANTAKVSVNGLVVGIYVFELTVTDNAGATHSDQVTVTVKGTDNEAPVANAGTDQIITLPASTVTLDGSASTDTDGTITKWEWTKVSGPNGGGGSFSAAGAAKTNVTGLTIAGDYVFQLTVTDNDNATNSVTVNIKVEPASNVAPIANAGNDKSITLPVSTVSLDGRGSSDSDGSIEKWEWTLVSGPGSGSFSAANSAQTNVTGLTIAGDYIFRLTVTDNSGASSDATIKVTVVAQAANKPPIANAGSNITITLPTSNVTLDGSASRDEDGTIATWTWKKISGPNSGTLSATNTAKVNLTGLTIEGTYVYELTVKDNSGNTAAARVNIIVLPVPNKAPVAVSQGNQTIQMPLDYIFASSVGSHDDDGEIASYQWQQISGETVATISRPTLDRTRISDLKPGEYEFELTVTDNNNATSTTTFKITVLPEDKLEGDSVLLYPNPARGFTNLNLEYPGIGSLKITIYDMKGGVRKVMLESVDRIFKKEISLAGFRSGQYLVEVIVNEQYRIVKKLMVIE